MLCQPRRAGTKIVCPRLETGNSSLTPCNSARARAWKNVTSLARPLPCDELYAELKVSRNRLATVQGRGVARVTRHRDGDEVERRIPRAPHDARSGDLPARIELHAHERDTAGPFRARA